MNAPERLQLAEATEVEWRPVPDFLGYYEASSEGEIRSLHTGTILRRDNPNQRGYLRCYMHSPEFGGHTIYQHRVIAETFLGPAEGRQINHKNGDKCDNRVANLEWVTGSQNAYHARYFLGHFCHPVLLTDIETGAEMEFSSIQKAADAIGVDRESVRRVAVAMRGSIHGYRVSRLPSREMTDEDLQTNAVTMEQCLGTILGIAAWTLDQVMTADSQERRNRIAQRTAATEGKS